MGRVIVGGPDRKLTRSRNRRPARRSIPMATIPQTPKVVDYPTSDGKPMGETDLHRQDMVDVIETLEDRYAEQNDVYVTGNLLLYYVEGDRRRHLSPDVFVVHGVPKLPPRDYYLLWEEGGRPTSSSRSPRRPPAARTRERSS